MTTLDRRRLRRRLQRMPNEASRVSHAVEPGLTDRWRHLHSRNRRRNESDSRSLIESLSHVHRLVMSGHSLESAIANAVLIQPVRELTALHSLMSKGHDIATASRFLVRSTPDSRDGEIALHVLSLAGTIGGRVADQIGSLIELLEDRDSIRRERRTQAASAAASMNLLTWLPFVCGAWILVDSASVRTFLFGSITGWICLVVGATLNLAGRVWMQRMVASC